MNPLTHVYISLELFKNTKLSKDERDHLIVGSILPDINHSGLIHFHRTHFYAKDFFNSTTNKLHKYLALGMILHGEDPKGVDYYAHGENGIIETYHDCVNKIAKKYKKYLGKITRMTSHHLIEYSADNIIAQKNKKIISLVLGAFKNPKIKSAITAFSINFKLSEKKNYKIISLLNNKHLLHFFENFATTETTSRSWVNFTFYINLKKGRNLPFKEKVKQLTKFSFYNIKRNFHHQEITLLFKEINLLMKQPVENFVTETIKSLRKLKNDLHKHIC